MGTTGPIFSLAMVVPAAAGAYGVRIGPFLFFAFLVKMARYWLLIIIVFAIYQINSS
jgi:membrane protein YqaA with SNARE-associated domain